MFAGLMRRGRLVALLCFLPLAAWAGGPADQATGFIQSLANQAIEILQAEETSLAERETKFHALLKEHFAVRTIGRFVIGQYWREATPEQQAEYLELFSDWIVKTYAVRFGGYTDERFTVTGTRVNPGDEDVFVGTLITKPDTSLAYKAEWRVRKMNDSYRIIDIEVEGLSMALAQRGEFNSVARRKGIDGLLLALRERINGIDGN